MKEISVPGSEPAYNRPAMRWSVEMDEDQAVKELRDQHYGSAEEVLEFTRGESREFIKSMAARRVNQLIKENDV